MSASTHNSPRIIIAGAGMSGLCLAIQLKQAGISSFQIFEKSDDVGGTWLDNHYPNSGCDVPSYLYSFSFGPKYDWSEKYARQPEILDYFRKCVDHFEIRPFIQFGTSIESATFDETEHVWTITTSNGQTHTADIFVSAVGQLNRPFTPTFDALETFQGEHWHTARWRDDVDLAGKDIAIVGNAASAIQILPGLAERAKTVTVFQRTPNWIHPLHNYKYPGWMRWMFRNVPLAARFHRYQIYLINEMRYIAFARKAGIPNRIYRWWLTRQMKAAASEELLPNVMPDYPPGCKRILLSSDYLQTLDRDNVRLVTDLIEKFVPEGIQTASETIPADATIFATGFETSDLLQPMQITGREGKSLHESWHGEPSALLGLMTPNFPNLFMLYGPNTNLGHNSIIFMVECQVKYLLNCLKLMQERGAKTIEPKQEAVEDYNRKLQKELDKTVWAAGCTNWYKTKKGHIVNNWSGPATAYWWRTRNVDPSRFQFANTSPAAEDSKGLEDTLVH